MSSSLKFLDEILSNKKKEHIKIRISIDKNYAEELLGALSKIFKIKREGDEKELLLTISNISSREIAESLIHLTPGCFTIELGEDEIIIKEISCPPCEEGKSTPLEKNTYLLPDGKFIVVDRKDFLRVYKCRVKL